MSSLIQALMHSQLTLLKEDINIASLKTQEKKCVKIFAVRALESSIKKESHKIIFVATFNPALQNIRQVNLNILLFFTTIPSSIFFFSLYIIPSFQRPTQKLTHHVTKMRNGEGEIEMGENRGQRSFGVTFERDLSLRFLGDERACGRQSR